MSPLDTAILAYRNDPSEANRQRVLALQAMSNGAFQERNAVEYIKRTK